MEKWQKARCGAEVLDVNQAFDIAVGASKGVPLDGPSGIIHVEPFAWYLTNKISDMLVACVGLEERLSEFARKEYHDHIANQIRNQEPIKLETMRNSLMRGVKAVAFKQIV